MERSARQRRPRSVIRPPASSRSGDGAGGLLLLGGADFSWTKGAARVGRCQPRGGLGADGTDGEAKEAEGIPHFRAEGFLPQLEECHSSVAFS